jgi:hypothetical protein
VSAEKCQLFGRFFSANVNLSVSICTKGGIYGISIDVIVTIVLQSITVFKSTGEKHAAKGFDNNNWHQHGGDPAFSVYTFTGAGYYGWGQQHYPR